MLPFHARQGPTAAGCVSPSASGAAAQGPDDDAAFQLEETRRFPKLAAAADDDAPAQDPLRPADTMIGSAGGAEVSKGPNRDLR